MIKTASLTPKSTDQTGAHASSGAALTTTRCVPRTRTEHVLRKRLLLCAVLVSLAASLPACSGSKPDIEVSIHRNELYAHMMFIKMQATADTVTIKDVNVNRGNCQLVDNSINRLAETVTLKFGEHWTAYPRDCSIDKVKEVEVTTDKGTFAYSF